MRPTQFTPDTAAALLRKQKIASLPELMAMLGTDARRTAFRKLRELSCLTSYSHCGRYYTLEDVAEFDERGLWSHRGVWFSMVGTLLETTVAFVTASEMGYFVNELDNLLHVGTKDVLRKLVRAGRLKRHELMGRFLYCAVDSDRGRRQIVARRALLAEPGIAGPLPDAVILPDELRAAIVLFFSVLDEQQRRLYAGLEALKSGYGGDTRIAELLGLNVGTVARGRRELLEQDIEVERVRGAGGGRKAVEKNTGSDHPHSGVDGARDSRRPDDRVKVDPQDNGQGRRRVAGAWHQGLRQNGGPAAQADELLVAC